MSELVRLARGCWLPPGEAADLRRQCAAVLALAPAYTALVDQTAARLHGLWLPDNTSRICLATRTPNRAPRAMTRPRRGELRTHRRMIAPDDLTVVDGLPVTTLARTWRDLAATLSLQDLVALGDSALRAGAGVAEIADVTRRRIGRPGSRSAAAALPLLNARSRSRPESHLRVTLAVAGLPPFAVNHAVTNDVGEWLAEPDLSCAVSRIALEYQGVEHAQIVRMRKDITRCNDMRRAGWVVLFYGPAEVFGRPWQIAPEVRQLIAERAPELLDRK